MPTTLTSDVEGILSKHFNFEAEGINPLIPFDPQGRPLPDRQAGLDPRCFTLQNQLFRK
jgi:hypothetical protein